MPEILDAKGNRIDSGYLQNKGMDSLTSKAWARKWLKDIKAQEAVFESIMPSRILDQHGRRMERKDNGDRVTISCGPARSVINA
jgi:hypothetical protein